MSDKDLIEKCVRRGIAIQRLESIIAHRNLEIDRLLKVWCTGGCTSGMHRYEPGPALTEHDVVWAERYAQRLRSRYNSEQHRKNQ